MEQQDRTISASRLSRDFAILTRPVVRGNGRCSLRSTAELTTPFRQAAAVSLDLRCETGNRFRPNASCHYQVRLS